VRCDLIVGDGCARPPGNFVAESPPSGGIDHDAAASWPNHHFQMIHGHERA
jgi:hypothetical protein